jgi:STAM-binding protein
MSHHQRTQGYTPSLHSMFTPPTAQPISPSLLFGSNAAPPPMVQTLYPTSLLPKPSQTQAHESSLQGSVPPSLQSVQSELSFNVNPQPDSPSRSMARRPDVSQSDLKTVNLPRDCLQRFLVIAKANTLMNRETCGLLLGKDKGTKFTVTTLLIPKQHSTSDTCTMDEEELVLQFTENRNLITLGWVSFLLLSPCLSLISLLKIHTHPSQSCMLSCLHSLSATQLYQVLCHR